MQVAWSGLPVMILWTIVSVELEELLTMEGLMDALILLIKITQDSPPVSQNLMLTPIIKIIAQPFPLLIIL
jgi:hypothetical protein